MVIGTSSVAMAAQTSRKTSYTENKQVLMRNLATGELQYSETNFANTYEYASKEYKKMEHTKTDLKEDTERNKGKGKGANQGFGGFDNEKLNSGALNSEPKKNKGIEDIGGKRLDENERLSSLVKQLREYMQNLRKRLQLLIGRRAYFPFSDGTIDLTTSAEISGKSFNLWKRTEYSSYTYSEQEEMSFSTKGKAITADGRELEFNMELFMSREFVEKTEELQSGVVAIMTDPLVINLTDNPISVSDKKWKFDIDADGRVDSISMLDEGAGYLALDRNGDGIINDGSELFGARTGNGFSELAVFDEDGNGWIDESDSVYRKLSVWVVDAKGNNRMISLKEANVGAVYLDNVASEYAMKSDKDNDYNAQIRRSGMYLSEEGKARSVQQLDMVKALIS